MRTDAGRDIRSLKRRRFLRLAAGAAALPLSAPFLPAPFLPAPAGAAMPPGDLRFRALHKGVHVGEHTVAFRADGERLAVTTHIDIAIKVLFFTAFRFAHDAEEVWQSGRLVSVTSTTNDDGTRLRVSGAAAGDGFRIVGEDGPFLAEAHLLTSNTLWNSRFVRETKMIDVQYGGEVGLVAKLLGEVRVDTPQGPVRASHHQIITPHYGGSLFYDADGRWVKGLIEKRGEILEYALAH
jgi:hypothetical protein